jgi:hypothetical protein
VTSHDLDGGSDAAADDNDDDIKELCIYKKSTKSVFV